MSVIEGKKKEAPTKVSRQKSATHVTLFTTNTTPTTNTAPTP
jgi:hypothetical protein